MNDLLISATTQNIIILVLLLIILIILKIFYTYHKKVKDYNTKLMKVSNANKLPSTRSVASNISKLKNYKEQFLSDVTHELKTPLTSISGFAETILTNPDLSEEKRNEFLNIILDETNRSVNLIKDILTIQKLDEISTEGFNTVNVLEVVTNVTKIVRNDNVNVDVIVDIDHDITVKSRKEHIMQILINLITNSLRHTESGYVKVSATCKRNEVILTVEDTGEGIPSNELYAVFKRFYRVDKDRSRKKGGTGLGLSIVKKITEQNNAKIELLSDLGKGTTVNITFKNSYHL